MQDFLAWLIRSQHKWQKCYASREGCHEDWNHPLHCAPLNHLACKSFALVAHEVQVVREHHNAISGRNASDGDESDQCGDADVVYD